MKARMSKTARKLINEGIDLTAIVLQGGGIVTTKDGKRYRVTRATPDWRIKNNENN